MKRLLNTSYFISRHFDRREKSLLLSMLILFFALSLQAQEERGLTRAGNKSFDKGNYADAEANYKKALEKKNNFPEAIFNLGDAIYKQNRNEDAAKQFLLASKTLTDPKQKAQAFHNLGNAYLQDKKYEEAVNAYKQGLKLNPNDRDSKYNLAYANAKLKEKNQNQNNKNDQNKDNKQDQKDKQDNKDQKQDDQKKDGQDKKDDQGKGDNKDNKEQQQQGQQPKLSKEAAEKLLQALQNEEQKTQEKMQKKQGKPVDVKIEKDW